MGDERRGVCIQADACSTWVLTVAQSVPRLVTMVSLPLTKPLTVMLIGASGSGALGVCGSMGAITSTASPVTVVGAMGSHPWTIRCAATVLARFWSITARRCVHRDAGVRGLSGHWQTWQTRENLPGWHWLPTAATPLGCRGTPPGDVPNELITDSHSSPIGKSIDE